MVFTLSRPHWNWLDVVNNCFAQEYELRVMKNSVLTPMHSSVSTPAGGILSLNSEHTTLAQAALPDLTPTPVRRLLVFEDHDDSNEKKTVFQKTTNVLESLDPDEFMPFSEPRLVCDSWEDNSTIQKSLYDPGLASIAALATVSVDESYAANRVLRHGDVKSVVAERTAHFRAVMRYGSVDTRENRVSLARIRLPTDHLRSSLHGAAAATETTVPTSGLALANSAVYSLLHFGGCVVAGLDVFWIALACLKSGFMTGNTDEFSQLSWSFVYAPYLFGLVSTNVNQHREIYMV